MQLKEEVESDSKYNSMSNYRLVEEFAGEIEDIWTEESIRASRRMLTVKYVAFVLLLFSTIFSLVEGLLPLKPTRMNHEED